MDEPYAAGHRENFSRQAVIIRETQAMLRSLRHSTLLTTLALGSIVAQIAAPAHAAGIIRITEVMSSGGTADWFELTNYGDASVDITGWKMDDSSAAFGTSVPLAGITSIASGTSVVFIEGTSPTADGFKTYWGGSVTTGVAVGSYTGSGIGLSSAGDGVAIFDSLGTLITQVTFGAATANSSFYWTYTPVGSVVTSAAISSAGNLSAFTSVTAPTNTGSPGVATTVAESADLYWAANGTSLGGSGTWNGGNTNWSSSDTSVSGAAWVANKNAFLKGTAGTVTIGSSVAAGNVSIESDGYTLAAGGGSLNTPAISVATAGHTATVGAQLVGTSGLTKNGGGLLVISNTSNSYSGGTSVVTGTLQSGAANVIPDASQLSAARLAVHDFAGYAETVGGISGLGSLTNIGGLTVNVTGTADVRFDGTVSGTGGFIVDSAGTGRQVFNSTNQTESDGAAKSYTGATIVRRGTLAIANGVNRVPNATSGVEIETNGRLELTSNAAIYTIGADANTVVTLKGGSLGQEQDEDVTLANAVNVASSSSILVKNTTTPVIPANTEEVTLSGVLSGSTGTILSLTASNQTPGADAGRVLFTNATGNSYAGTVAVGQNMTGRFNGDYSTTPVLLTGGAVEGNGTVKSIGGLGLVSPGTSPGILTAESVDPASGIDFAFEFTAVGGPTYNAPAASVNDVLRLTGGSPLTGSLTSANVVDLFLGVTALAENDVFQGGLFTLTDSTSALAGATLQAFVLGDGLGIAAFLNGQGYYSLSQFAPSFSLDFDVVAVTADFGSGGVEGYVTQFTAVPEPGTLLLAACGAAIAAWQLRRRRQSLAPRHVMRGSRTPNTFLNR
jgi:autotransporter-associated beta strand protein